MINQATEFRKVLKHCGVCVWSMGTWSMSTAAVGYCWVKPAYLN